MIRCMIGAVFGLVFAAGILAGTNRVLALTISPMQSMEHSAIYVSMILGAGFGAVAAALARPREKSAGHAVEQGVEKDRPR